MTTLPTRVNWDGTQRPASAAEVGRAQGKAARIRREVTEIRTAAEQLAVTGSPFDAEVAAFLTAQATLLERAGGTPGRADSMRKEEDTLHESGTFPTAARSALLIARAHLAG